MMITGRSYLGCCHQVADLCRRAPPIQAVTAKVANETQNWRSGGSARVAKPGGRVAAVSRLQGLWSLISWEDGGSGYPASGRRVERYVSTYLLA